MKSTRYLCVVDDSADYRVLIQMVFIKFLSAYSVRYFDSGQALLEELPISPRPSLILLDRHMPVFDGHKTLVHLKESADLRNVPVIMMSAAATDQEIEGCYKSGANSFMRKPVDLVSLKDVLTITCQYWLEINQAPFRQ